MKKWISIVFAFAIFVSASLYGYNLGESVGYESGYDKGRLIGYDQGYAAASSDKKFDIGSFLTDEMAEVVSERKGGEFVAISEEGEKYATTKTPSSAKEITVYITNTGEKYHRSGCQYLHSSKIAINKSTAIARGYSACSRCY